MRWSKLALCLIFFNFKSLQIVFFCVSYCKQAQPVVKSPHREQPLKERDPYKTSQKGFLIFHLKKLYPKSVNNLTCFIMKMCGQHKYWDFGSFAFSLLTTCEFDRKCELKEVLWMPPKKKQTPGANYGFIENLVRYGGAYSRSQETDSEQLFCLP